MILQETPSGQLLKNVKYYAAFQLIFVVIVVSLSSIGAFFHFLLEHEISILESWLHNNQWEILILAKLLSLFLLNRWFKVRLYQLKSFKNLVQELISWPDPKSIVVAVFMLVSYISLGKTLIVSANIGYWYNHFTSFFGLFVFFGIEFILIAYIEDILNQKVHPSRLHLGVIYTIIFGVAFRLSVPDYYGLMPYVILCYSSLIYLSGPNFKSWSNVVCFLLLFVAPIGSLFGLDPVWGDDFSPFRLSRKLNLAFLAVIWMISFFYYRYRDQFLNSTRKLLR
jgi:hypothetical protein